MQLNTPNRFVPDLVWVSPNTSDVQQLGRCVLALTLSHGEDHPVQIDIYTFLECFPKEKKKSIIDQPFTLSESKNDND